ncbi:MAG: DUF998 domain-containing protein [Chitinophagaceae bacterium]|nr:DUF998 domain-containing protein [Chitinophagaceae bacterium]
MILNNGISKTTKALLICGQTGCILFIAMFLIQGQLREGYTPLKFPISSLSIGQFGWIQITNFIISGVLIFLSAIGFRQATPSLKNSIWISRLIGAVGFGLVGAGLFSSDPVYGYPTTEPLAVAQFTIHGHLHDFFSIIVFVCLPIAIFKMRNRFKEANNNSWAAYSFLSGIGILTFFILAGIGFKQVRGLVELAGVLQRLSIIIGCVWMAAISFLIIKSSRQI